jgi:hypothetical protein
MSAKGSGAKRGPTTSRAAKRHDRLSLAPLNLEEALRGAMQTGAPPPGPKRKPKPEGEKKPPAKRGRKPGPAKRG